MSYTMYAEDINDLNMMNAENDIMILETQRSLGEYLCSVQIFAESSINDQGLFSKLYAFIQKVVTFVIKVVRNVIKFTIKIITAPFKLVMKLIKGSDSGSGSGGSASGIVNNIENANVTLNPDDAVTTFNSLSETDKRIFIEKLSSKFATDCLLKKDDSVTPKSADDARARLDAIFDSNTIGNIVNTLFDYSAKTDMLYSKLVSSIVSSLGTPLRVNSELSNKIVSRELYPKDVIAQVHELYMKSMMKLDLATYMTATDISSYDVFYYRTADTDIVKKYASTVKDIEKKQEYAKYMDIKVTSRFTASNIADNYNKYILSNTKALYKTIFGANAAMQAVSVSDLKIIDTYVNLEGDHALHNYSTETIELNEDLAKICASKLKDNTVELDAQKKVLDDIAGNMVYLENKRDSMTKLHVLVADKANEFENPNPPQLIKDLHSIVKELPKILTANINSMITCVKNASEYVKFSRAQSTMYYLGSIINAKVIVSGAFVDYLKLVYSKCDDDGKDRFKEHFKIINNYTSKINNAGYKRLGDGE